MALIVEDGTTSGGVANAESYVSVAYADTYFSDRGFADWALLTTAQKEAALRKSCTYLDQGWEWIGARRSGSQYLMWPRSVMSISHHGHWVNLDLYLPGITTIPLILKQAQCELAKESLTQDLGASYDPTQTVESETIGPLSVSYAASRFGMANPVKRYPLVTIMLKDLTTGSNTVGLSGSAVRA